MNHITARMVLSAILLLPVMPMGALAQTTDATVTGTVSDTTGALIPGATVTSHNIGTGIVNVTVTNESGNYRFSNLQTGTYEITAELPGFRTARYTDVTLGLGQQVRLNFTLDVAAAATAIDVVAAADTALTATSASVGSVLPEREVRELPSTDRNVLELLRGIAGTGPTGRYRHDGVGRAPQEGNFSGSRIRDTNITRDGFTVADGRYDHGAFATTYSSSDLVEEVRVSTGTVDAGAGRGSGQVQMVTRSGTNQFRGSVFWSNRNSALDAAHWFNNFHGTDADWENRNQYGFRLGGPIVRDKTFFFFLTDNQRWVAKEDFVGTVLTAEARQDLYRYFPGATQTHWQTTRPWTFRAIP